MTNAMTNSMTNNKRIEELKKNNTLPGEDLKALLGSLSDEDEEKLYESPGPYGKSITEKTST